MADDGQYQLIFGDGSNMEVLRNEEVDLVITSPPYFSSATEPLLRKPIREQTEVGRVREEITAFALKLRPVYNEIRRVLKPGGTLVVQIKDIRYGGFIIPLASLHREMIESTGLNLLSRVFWHKFNRRSKATSFARNPLVGSFRSDEVEELLIFSDTNNTKREKTPVALDPEEISLCTSPLWTMSPAGKGREHPHQAPRILVKRMISLFSEPGDLIVDPFAGAGTTLAVAIEMGRRAVGYEIEEHYAQLADDSIERAIIKNSKS